MRANIVRIGNSQGIRIPKVLIEQCGLGSEVELEVEDNKLVIHSVSSPRQGWEEIFQSMAVAGDDALLDGELAGQSTLDETEWQW
ncbi:MAG: AbrB/MazE/SpoVT family DNA-binding domain-containing protein [Desulfobulbaceae bacterium]|nr:AbrB/MazE/SpoVT family DNA-binding domain-containing protein [Desulfobulbaceae bacterium]